MQEGLSEVVLILVGSTGIILVLTTLIVTSLFISEKRKFRHRRELSEMKINYEREVYRTQLETQAQTFETISRELHDNVGMLISMAMVHLKSSTADGKMKETESLLDEALLVLRDISRSINPENIQKMGLSQAIRNETERIRRSRMFRASFVVEGEEFSIEPQKQIILFRIVQESLNNAIRHARASEVSVTLRFSFPALSLSIKDDGRGFINQPGQGSTLHHSGLTNMQKRAKLIGAQLHIQSELDKGTNIQLEFPGDQGVQLSEASRWPIPE
jgi:two-component system NarL family sensor kinase